MNWGALPNASNAACPTLNAASDQCHPLIDDAINRTDLPKVAATATQQVGEGADGANPANAAATTTASEAADRSSSSKSLFLSREASSIFDRALEMHAAPTDDPPMWGDDLSLGEVAVMLDDIGDLSTCDDAAAGQGDLYSIPNFKATGQREEALGCLPGDSPGPPCVSGDRGEESKADFECGATMGAAGPASLSCEAGLSDHIMNMDKRIFEDDMFVGDAQDESYPMDYTRGGIFDDGRVFDSAMPDMLNPMRKSPTFPDRDQGNLDAPGPEMYREVSPGSPSRIIELERGTSFSQISPVVTPLSHQMMPKAQLKDILAVPKTVLKQKSSGSCSAGCAEKAAGTATMAANDTRTRKSDAAWKKRFAELEGFKREHGHTNVNQKYQKNPSLGAWVARQRLLMRHWEDQGGNGSDDSKALRTSEKIQLLRSIGLESSIGKGAFGKSCSRNTNEWEKQFADLLKYQEANGDCNVPTKCTSLGRWVSSQRKKYRDFLAEEGQHRGGEAFGWDKELQSRFQRLRDIGFTFHLGKGNAPTKATKR